MIGHWMLAVELAFVSAFQWPNARRSNRRFQAQKLAVEIPSRPQYSATDNPLPNWTSTRFRHNEANFGSATRPIETSRLRE